MSAANPAARRAGLRCCDEHLELLGTPPGVLHVARDACDLCRIRSAPAQTSDGGAGLLAIAVLIVGILLMVAALLG